MRLQMYVVYKWCECILIYTYIFYANFARIESDHRLVVVEAQCIRRVGIVVAVAKHYSGRDGNQMHSHRGKRY